MTISGRQRAVLATMTGWFGLGWALIEFSGFLTQRYAAPDWIIDAVFASMWAFLPLVFTISFWIAEEGRMEWTRRRRSIAFSLLIAGVVIVPVSVMQAGDAGAPAQADTTSQDAAPPLIALFPFTVQSDAPDDAWLGNAVPLFSEVDLAFDSRIQGVATNGASSEPILSAIRGLGTDSLALASPAIQRQAARSLGFQAMVSGAIRRSGERLTATVEIDRLDPDAALGPFTVDAGNPWELIDAICRQVRDTLAEPGLDGASDPALRTFTSHSEPALRHYVSAVVAIERDREFASAAWYLDQAVAADSGFVLAELARVRLMFTRTQFEEARSAMRLIEPRFGILPERSRFAAQIELAQAFGDTARLRAVLALWAERFPRDATPRLALARMDVNDRPHDEEPWEILRALILQSGSTAQLLALSQSMLLREQLDDAESLALRAAQRAPANVDVLRQLARIDRARGRHPAALDRLQQATLLRPDLVPLRREIAGLQFEAGAWRQALDTLTEARAIAAGHPAYRSVLLETEVRVLHRLGRVVDANARLDELEQIENARLPPSALFNRFVTFADIRARAYGIEAARAWNFRWQPRNGESGRDYANALFDFVVAGELRDAPLYDSATRRMQQLWPVTSAVAGDRSTAPHRAMAAAWIADDRQTFASLEHGFQQQQAMHAAGAQPVDAVEAYRLQVVDQALRLEQWQDAERWLEPLLVTRPGDPSIRWRQARLAERIDKHADARDALRAILDAWADADDGFAPAAEARAMAERLAVTAPEPSNAALAARR